MKGMGVVHRAAAVAMVGGAIALQPAPVAAQAKLELTPFFASYYGVQNVTDDADNDGSGVQVKQIPAPGVGGRLTFWISPTLGVEAAGTYAWSDVRLFFDDPVQPVGFSLGGSIVLASGRVLYRPPRSNFHVLAGVGLVSRSGDFWKFYEEQITGQPIDKLSTVAGVLGFGARAAVTPKIALNVTAEGYLYGLNPESGGNPIWDKTNTQIDVLVSIGIPIALMK